MFQGYFGKIVSLAWTLGEAPGISEVDRFPEFSRLVINFFVEKLLEKSCCLFKVDKDIKSFLLRGG